MEYSIERKTVVCFHRLDVIKIVNILKDQGWQTDGNIYCTVCDYRQNLIRKRK